jgi:hypothetical protein
MIKDIPAYLDEALKDSKVCPLIVVDIQEDPIIRKEFHIQKSIKQLLKERFKELLPCKQITLKILNNANDLTKN